MACISKTWPFGQLNGVSHTLIFVFFVQKDIHIYKVKDCNGLILVLLQFHKFFMICRWKMNDRKETSSWCMWNSCESLENPNTNQCKWWLDAKHHGSCPKEKYHRKRWKGFQESGNTVLHYLLVGLCEVLVTAASDTNLSSKMTGRVREYDETAVSNDISGSFKTNACTAVKMRHSPRPSRKTSWFSWFQWNLSASLSVSGSYSISTSCQWPKLKATQDLWGVKRCFRAFQVNL